MVEQKTKLKDFVEEMRKRVEEKQGEYGDSWKTMGITELRQRVLENYFEWQDIVLERRTTKDVECRKLVDLANLCQFLFLRLRELGV